MSAPADDTAPQAGLSLARRLLLLSFGWTALLLIVTGLVLSTFNQRLVEQGFDRRLQVYVKLLIADVANAVDDREVQVGGNLGEPLFELPQSGWYWQVTRTDGGRSDTRASRSLWDAKLEPLDGAPPTPGVGRAREGYLTGPADQRLRAVERTVELGEDGEYLVIVAGNADDISAGTERFRRILLGTLSLLGIGFIVAALFQVRFGLKPLQNVAAALSRIRNGEAAHLDGRFPREVAPLVSEVNALIDHNREVVERARTHVGNLAHALKTPLSVLQNEAATSRSALSAKVGEQTMIMRQQVNHHLERARMAARIEVVSAVIDVTPVVESLVRTMQKINRGRGLTIETTIDEPLKFRGEQHDLEEMLGNLIDNACKWARRLVAVKVAPVPVQGAFDRQFLAITIDDDGPGLTPEQRREIGRRGLRLDESKPGTGLGLSIVGELASLYGGGVTFDESPFGGLRVVLKLPSV